MHTPILSQSAPDTLVRDRAQDATGLAVPLLLALLVWPVIVAAAASLYVMHTLRGEQTDLLAFRPPIAVIDTHQFIEQQPLTASTNARLQAGFKQANLAAMRLKESGFLIIDRAQVLSAPGAIEVPPVNQK